MYLYYSLRNLASHFGALRGEFADLGNNIRDIWLIGQWLSTPFYIIAGLLGTLENIANDVAGDWLGFYNWINDNLGIDDRIRDLLRYADDLISLILHPFDWIADTIQNYFPDLFRFMQDPIANVLEIITRYTGLDWDFLDSPLQWVQDKIRDLAGEAIEISRDPIRWLQDRLAEIIPDWWDFIHDARLWVRKRIEEEFPDLIAFLRDPDDFLEDKLLLFLDRFQSKYRNRVVKIAEKIIDVIF